SEAGGPIAVPMSRDELGSGSDHLWGGNPSDGGALVEDGRVGVLNCTCGFFPCGGGTARITFDRDTVTWSEFSVANSRQRVELSSFEFARNEYEERLALI